MRLLYRNSAREPIPYYDWRVELSPDGMWRAYKADKMLGPYESEGQLDAAIEMQAYAK